MLLSKKDYPKNDNEYNKLIEKLDSLLTIVGNNENHFLMGLVDVISLFIEEYEKEKFNVEQKKTSPLDSLKYLMDAHKLTQSDLPEIGTQGVISEILHGKRHLNIRQIKLLSKRFNVNPAIFIENE